MSLLKIPPRTDSRINAIAAAKSSPAAREALQGSGGSDGSRPDGDPRFRPQPRSLGGSRAWLMLSLGSLVSAGLLALVLVGARVPGISLLFRDPLFAKRCLVVHVELALGVWLFAFLAALSAAAAPARAGARGGFGKRLRYPFAAILAAAGVALMAAAAFRTGAKPILANYLPAIEHPVFFLGMGALAAGLGGAFLVNLLRGLFLPPVGPATRETGPVPGPVQAGLRAAMAVFLLALATLAVSYPATPGDLPADSRYELLFWGTGHLLQLVHLIGMAAVWLLLIAETTGESPLKGARAEACFALLAAPAFAGPVLAMAGTQSRFYHSGFTLLMRWGTWPVAMIILAACARALWRARVDLPRPGDSRFPYLAGFFASAGLTTLGFILGACIRGPNTMVPAHYHAAVGGVTAAYMAGAYWLIRVYGAGSSIRAGGVGNATGRRARLMAWQPALYGAGQAVFALGFGFAGAHGAARKAYGQEQHLHSLAERVGMGVMGIGSLLAVTGGLLFLALALSGIRGGALATAADTASNPETRRKA